jgi:hypothetical protein
MDVFKSEAVNMGNKLVPNSLSDINFMKNKRYFKPKAEKRIFSTVTRCRTPPCLHIQVLFEKGTFLPMLFPEEISPH